MPTHVSNYTKRMRSLYKKKHGIRANAAATQRMRRQFYLSQRRSGQRMHNITVHMPPPVMENEMMSDVNEHISNTTRSHAPMSKKKWINMTEEEKEAIRVAKTKAAKEKAKKQQRIAAKARRTRAATKAREEEEAKAAKMVVASKKMTAKKRREALVSKLASIRDEFAARVAAAKEKRAAGNIAAANAMEDDIRADIRKRFNNENNVNKGETGLEAFFNNLGL